MLGSTAVQLARDERAQASTLFVLLAGLVLVGGVLLYGRSGGSDPFGELLALNGPINQLFNPDSDTPSAVADGLNPDSGTPFVVADEFPLEPLPATLPDLGDGPVSQPARTSPVSVAALGLATLALVTAARLGSAPRPRAPAD